MGPQQVTWGRERFPYPGPSRVLMQPWVARLGQLPRLMTLMYLCRSQMDNERKSNTSKHSYSGRVHLCVARYR